MKYYLGLRSSSLIVVITLLFSIQLSAQWDHQAVFPELEGNQLKQALIDSYQIEGTLTDQRDTLFSKIDAKENRLSCIYTDYTITLNPNQDPTQDAFSKGINTEHVYPKSKGADNHNGEYDMHHLFPSREDINNYRASKAFNEIPDNQTARWYYLDVLQNNTPSNNIDEYSEVNGDFIEPREEVKGNIARAMMYFYTMYEERANADDPNYFSSQMSTLCEWHYEDPVDEDEWNRTFLIAPYQEDKVNPYILDCGLAARMFCGELSEECRLVPTEEIMTESLNISYVPSSQSLSVINAANTTINVYLFNGTGQLIFKKSLLALSNEVQISIEGVQKNSLYHVLLSNGTHQHNLSFFSH